MRKLVLPFVALSLIALAACGQKAKNEAAGAKETIGGDSNTMGEAVADVNAAQAAAFNDAEAAYAGNKSEKDTGAGNEIFD